MNITLVMESNSLSEIRPLEHQFMSLIWEIRTSRKFLVGSTIPDYILQLPNEVTSSPVSRLMLPMIQNLETSLRSGAVSKVPEAVMSDRLMVVVARQLKGSLTRKHTKNSTCLAVEPAAGAGHQKLPGKTIDESPLRDARAVIRDKINGEFASIMTTGKFRASEAAALAARREMSKYTSLTSAAASQDWKL